MTNIVEMEPAARIQLFDQLLLRWMQENKLLDEEAQEALRQIGQTVGIVSMATARGSYPDNIATVYVDSCGSRVQ